MHTRRILGAAAVLGSLALTAACGGSGDTSTTSSGGFVPPKMKAQQTLGKSEGKLNLIAKTEVAVKQLQFRALEKLRSQMEGAHG